MYTVIYEEVDGHKIVLGFDRAQLDPVATMQAIAPMLAELPETKALNDKKAEYGRAYREFLAAAKARDNNAYAKAMDDMKHIMEELLPLADAHTAAVASLKASNAVYFEPGPHEAIISRETMDGLMAVIKTLPEGVYCDTEGKRVPDNRGKAYYHRVKGKWQRGVVAKMGDGIPAGTVAEPDLSDTQKAEVETDRIAALSAEERIKEKADIEEKLMTKAKDMRAEAEIRGDAAALEKAQAWYSEAMKEVDRIYK